MNEPNSGPERQIDAPAAYCAKADHEAHLHAGLNFLAALGIGLAVGALFYALRPTPPRDRLPRLLADMEKRLRDLAKPALRRANDFASEGAVAIAESADAIAGGVHGGEARVEHFLRDAGRRLRGFWS